MSNPEQTFEGILLRVVDYREKDCVVTWLGQGVGKGAGFARGARASKKRFPGGLELFRWYRLTVKASRRSGSGLPILAQADALRDLPRISDSLESIAIASCVVELARALSHEGESQDELLALCWATLEGLHVLDADDAPRLHLALRWFELRALGLHGVAPQLGQCVRTDIPAGQCSELAFSVSAGGVLDADSVEPADRAVRVGRSLVAGLYHLQQASLREVLERAATHDGDAARTESRAHFVRTSGRLMRQLLDDVTSMKLKAYQFLATLET